VVFGICLKYLKNREESKDAVMQIFEKILSELKEKEVKNFPGWIYVVSKNFCLMKLRALGKSRIMDHLEIDTFNPVMENPYTLHHNDELNFEDRSEALSKCLEGLSEKQKKCITLFYYDDKCYEEITRITGYELKKVKSYLQNGKRNLKNCMDKQDVKKREKS
jgi:RNA polymerase sigma-70 factor (ECF subfamily)